MLDIKFIRENIVLVKRTARDKNLKVDIDCLIKLDKERRGLQTKLDELRSDLNKKSKGKPTAIDAEKLRALGDEIKELEKQYARIESEYTRLMMEVPNLIHPEVPIGGEEDYRVLEMHGEPPHFNFKPKDHEELMISLDLLDFERGAKVAGAKFYFYKNDMVRLSLALINYGIEIITKHGFTLVETPDVAKNEILAGIGFNPRGPETQVYSLENTDLSLIGTAEITMGGYHANEVLDLSQGPKKYAALSHCFRTEAGSYGKTSKGLYRVHQFTKLEMFIFCKPEESERLHQELLEIEKEICNGLNLVYRVIDCASRDLGAPAYRKFDIEAWMTVKGGREGKPGDYGEISSTSNCTDYQARRLNIKYRKPDGTTEFVHTLNSTGVVLSRFPLAIVEQYQQADGSVLVPRVLQKFVGKKRLEAYGRETNHR